MRCARHAGAPPCRSRGFLLLPVVLTLALIASVALSTNRDSGNSIAMLAARAEQDRARLAAEAGLQHANQSLQQIGCAGPYPVAGVSAISNPAFGEASYTAQADRSSGSPVVLSATGSYRGATVTLSRPGVHVYQGTLQSFTLQPESASASDTYVSPSAPSANHGGEPTLRLANGGQQPLLQFGLTALPPGSRPVSLWNATTGSFQPGAQLSLYQTQLAVGGGNVSAQLITRPWLAGTGLGTSGSGATWNTSDGSTAWPVPGGGYALAPVASMASPATIGWQNWDLTDTTTAWLDGIAANHGVWLVASPGMLGALRYVSADEPRELTRRPKLALSYLLPCGTSPPKRVTLIAIRDTEIDSSSPNSDRGNAGHMSVIATKEQRALIAFSTASIPPGSTIASATLRLYNEDTSGGSTSTAITLTASAIINQAWTSDASWNERTGNSSESSKAWVPTRGGTFRATPAATTTLPAAFPDRNWVEFDLTALAREWVDGMTPNLGVIIRSITPATDNIEFTSINDGESWRHPQLIVTYR